MQQKDIQGKGYFRKSKAYGLVCGIALFGALAVGSTVSADEVTTTVETTPTVEAVNPNPATNLTTVQEAPSTESVATEEKSGTSTGEIVSPVTSSELSNAVDSAKDAGVTVTEETKPVIYNDLSSAQQDLSKQASEVKVAEDKQEQNTTAIKDAIATNEEIDRQNKAEAERVAEVNRVGQTEVDARNKAGQEAVDATNLANKQQADTTNAQLKSEYEAKLAEIAQIEEHNAGVRKRNAEAIAWADAENARRQAEYEAKLADYEALGKLSENTSANVMLVGQVDKSATGSKYYANLKAVYTGTDSSVKGIEALGFKNGLTTITDANGVRISNYADGTPDGTTIVSSVKGIYVVSEVSEGATFKINNLGKTTEGNIIHAIVTVSKVEKDNSNLSYFTVGYQDEGSEYNSLAVDYRNFSRIGLNFRFVDDAGKSIKLISSFLVGDVDFGQSADVSYGYNGASMYVDPDSRLVASQYGMMSDGGWGADSLNSAPLGTLVAYGVSDNINYIHTNALSQDNGLPFTNYTGPFVEFLLFGTSSKVETIFPSPPVVPVSPELEKEVPVTPPTPNYVTPTVVKFTPESYTPIKPVVLPHVSVPEKVTYSASVHPVLVKQAPVNVKSVVNEDGVNVDGQLVPKGSVQTWVLTNTSLKAGRPVTTSYSMTDPLPAGFEVDVKATAEKNSAWVFSYDENGRGVLTATESTLKLLNANLNQDVGIPLAYFVGRTLNDGGTYKNTFVTNIGTPSGIYTTVSNIPVIYTPGNDPKTPRPPRVPNGENPTPHDNLIQPKKDVVDEKGNSINGQSVLPNSTLNYVATQDFDQYKGIVASQSSIAKGFVYVDDYLDKALDGQSMVVNSITAKNGDDVRELLDMYHVLSQDALDEKLQALIKESGISPVGEFYLWVAKDPEAFYKSYVSKGLDITYNLSFKIKKEFTEGQITNQTFQIDFGNGYYGNIVTNDLPLIAVHKEVLNKDGQSINNGTVSIGDEVVYKLEGWVVPAGRGYDLHEYRFVDLLQQSHDEFKAYSIEASVDITLSDGTVIKAGQDLSVYTETVYNADTGLFELRFREDFLSQIPRSSEFGSDAYLTVTRIASGTVENEYTLYVNGNPVVSEKVVTETPEPPKPEPKTPKQKAPALPSTGQSSSLGLTVIGMVALFGSLFGLRKKNEE
ncbi:TPA: LPXTG cell wall anchor domain-containing protein [Streptococcus suis]|nr:LPXTG cell wall anchor domain-containing protein [Streptococcus suis]